MTSESEAAGLRLLVVDDEEQILELLDLTLTMQGYQVCTASGGPQALAVLESQSVDVIIMDVLMTPWDGFETVRQLHRTVHPLPPIVFLSGLNRPDSMPEFGSDVVVDYLLKPFRPSELMVVIDRAWATRTQISRKA